MREQIMLQYLKYFVTYDTFIDREIVSKDGNLCLCEVFSDDDEIGKRKESDICVFEHL